jgi:EAL domain-containing protein (putative c-di-GMP-specific phosphodiesterase class I)
MYLQVILSRFRETMDGLQDLAVADSVGKPPKRQWRTDDALLSTDYETALHEIRMEEEISRALHRDEFALFLQPIIDLGNKTIVGFESLIRWQHQERGLLAPGEFLGTAEASGLIVPMGSWIFRRSCEFLGMINRALRKSGSAPLFISVNVSAGEIASPYFADAVTKIVQDAGVSASEIKLEVTETALIQDHATAAQALQQLKDAGFSIVLDDFGTGYSSLSYLHEFPFDTLKIDRRFVQHVHQAPKNKAILASIASLAEHLDLSVVAEGIETSFQEKIIRDLKCGYGQGFLYARPMSEAMALDFLRQREHAAHRELTA